MATVQDYPNGANGANGINGLATSFPPPRFSAVPPLLSIPVLTDTGETYDIEVSLQEDGMPDDPFELCEMLETERASRDNWLNVAVAYAKHKKVDLAIETLTKSSAVFGNSRSEDRLGIYNALCWLYLLKCREAPRVKPGKSISLRAVSLQLLTELDDRVHDEDLKLKDHYIQQATSVLNDASRINPSYAPLFLARGVLYLLRASLQAPPTSAGSNQISSERLETLKQAAKCFEDALRASHGKNLMAKLGKARVNYSMGKYPEALKLYQQVLESSPNLVDPDPRIGIGCCFWYLGHKDEAAGAWERSLELVSAGHFCWHER